MSLINGNHFRNLCFIYILLTTTQERVQNILIKFDISEHFKEENYFLIHKSRLIYILIPKSLPKFTC